MWAHTRVAAVASSSFSPYPAALFSAHVCMSFPFSDAVEVTVSQKTTFFSLHLSKLCLIFPRLANLQYSLHNIVLTPPPFCLPLLLLVALVLLHDLPWQKVGESVDFCSSLKLFLCIYALMTQILRSAVVKKDSADYWCYFALAPHSEEQMLLVGQRLLWQK